MNTWRQWFERNPAGRGKIYHYAWDIDLDKPWDEPAPSAPAQNSRTGRPELQSVLDNLPEMQREELPDLLGKLEVIRATSLIRLSAPVAPSDQHDKLVEIETAAERLGVSKEYLFAQFQALSFHPPRSDVQPAHSVTRAGLQVGRQNQEIVSRAIHSAPLRSWQ
jgi:hypothetical protein